MNYYDFFDALKANNNRDWFLAHKDTYTALRAQWVATMGGIMARISTFWPQVAGLDAGRATYRIYRDLRFSADKTPYKTHLGTLIEPGGGKLCRAGLYVQIGSDTDLNGVYAGIWHPDNAKLRKLRKAIDDNAEEFAAIAADPALTKAFGPEWHGDALKTAPKGYAKDHPLIDFLRLKDIGKCAALTRRQVLSADFADIVVQKARAAMPLINFINYSLDEEI